MCHILLHQYNVTVFLIYYYMAKKLFLKIKIISMHEILNNCFRPWLVYFIYYVNI